MRYDFNLKGKTGKLPNPFDGTHCLEDDSEQKIRLELDDNKIPIPYLIPKVDVEQNKENKKIEIHIDAKDKNNFKKILEKVLKRHGIKNDNYKINYDLENYIRSFRPVIKIEKNIDLRDFKIGLLKIAYEFAVDSIEEYLYDEKAKEISRILYNAELEEVDNYVLGTGFEKDMLSFIESILDFESKKHYLVLINGKDLGLLCLIHLSSLFQVVVRISDSNLLKDNIIFGINDLEKKEFRKTNIFEIANEIYSPMEYQYKFYFENEIDLEEYKLLELDERFNYFYVNDKIPLYNVQGKVLYSDINEKIEKMMLNNNIVYLGDGFKKHINYVKFDEELYIKIVPSNKLIKLDSLFAKQFLKGKL